MAVRIEPDGEVTVFAGADKRPIATALPSHAKADQPIRAIVPRGDLRSGVQDIAGILAWIDAVGATGLDGHDLHELGLKNGQLTVDDQRNGKHWTFDSINASLRRPEQGGVIFQLASDDKKRPWLISAAMRPLEDGMRAVGLEARQVSMRDILLALRVKDGDISADLPLSASIRADIAADGTPQLVQGEVVSGAGTITDHDGPDLIHIGIDRADFRFHWDARRHTLVMPFQVQAEGNQFTMRAVMTAPSDKSGIWQFDVTRGDPVIDPVILAPLGSNEKEGFALNRVNVRGRIDTKKRRIELDQGDFSRSDTRPSHNVGVAVTGSLDYSKPDPHLAFGVAGTRMPMSVMKRVWPVNIASHGAAMGREARRRRHRRARRHRRQRADVDLQDRRTADARRRPVHRRRDHRHQSLRPIPDLPPIDDADLTVRITGRTATIRLGRGVVNVAPGRSAQYRRRRLLGARHPSQAVAGAGRVPHRRQRAGGGACCSPTRSCATMSGSSSIPPPAAAPSPPMSRSTCRSGAALPKNSVRYAVSAVLSSFGADKTLMGEKLEASSLRVAAVERRRLQDQGQRQDQRAAGGDRRRQEERRRGRRPASCRPSSTRPRAASSASISATPSAARFPSSSPARSTAAARTTGSIWTPISRG